MVTSISPELTSIVVCPSCHKRNRVSAVGNGAPSCATCQRPLPWLVEADNESYAAAVSSALPVLIVLTTPWCAPCRQVEPFVAKAASRFAGRLKVVEVNVDDAAEVAHHLGVLSVPTLVVVHDGREIAREVGALPSAALIAWLAHVLAPAA